MKRLLTALQQQQMWFASQVVFGRVALLYDMPGPVNNHRRSNYIPALQYKLLCFGRLKDGVSK
jgi:hypothetical protein